MKTNFQGKRILLTGASAGLGRELAMEFARCGGVLALISRNEARLKNTAQAIRQAFPNVADPLIIPCDVADQASVSAAVEQCARTLCGVDVLVNNAGIGVYGDFCRMTSEDFEQTMKVNYLGAVYATMRVLPLMQQEKGGLIVNIASAVALHGVPFMTGYSASKAALAAFSQSLRAELADSPLSVAIVYPGSLETHFFNNEKRVGGAHRRPGPYRPAAQAAQKIVRALARGKTDVFITSECQALRLGLRFSPSAVRLAMAVIARKLRNKERQTP